MRVQPLHQLFAHGGIIETSLRKIKDNKKGKTGIQCPVVVGIIMKGLWSVHRFLSRGVSALKWHRRNHSQTLAPSYP
jgi:hypothetical protein